MPPLGMSWITSYLRSQGISTSLVDFQIHPQSVESLLQMHGPKIVGIGGTTHTRYASFDIAHRVKAADPSIVVLYGGSHASFTADDTLRHIPDIDVVVRGEGELTTYALAQHYLRGKKNLAAIRGISYRQNDSIVHNPDVERIRDLDTLPFPYRDPETIHRYNLTLDFLHGPAASVMSSRGCPVNCSFCSASAMFGTQLTFRSASNVVDEIDLLLKEYKYEGIKFFDSTLTLNRHHVEALCNEIQRRQLRFPWECEVRVNGVSRDLLCTMKEAGCYYVDFGVESVSPRILKRMHKGITVEQVENVFRWTNELDLYTKVFFTFGHIGESWEDARETVAFLEKNARYIDVIATGIGVRVYPGTEVGRYATSIGSISNDFSWTAPFRDQRIESLGNDPSVPILLQPQFGWKEFRKVEFRLARFWLGHPSAALRALWSQLKLGRGIVLLRLVIRFFNMHFFKRSSTTWP